MRRLLIALLALVVVLAGMLVAIAMRTDGRLVAREALARIGKLAHAQAAMQEGALRLFPWPRVEITGLRLVWPGAELAVDEAEVGLSLAALLAPQPEARWRWLRLEGVRGRATPKTMFAALRAFADGGIHWPVERWRIARGSLNLGDYGLRALDLRWQKAAGAPPKLTGAMEVVAGGGAAGRVEVQGFWDPEAGRYPAFSLAWTLERVPLPDAAAELGGRAISGEIVSEQRPTGAWAARVALSGDGELAPRLEAEFAAASRAQIVVRRVALAAAQVPVASAEGVWMQGAWDGRVKLLALPARWAARLGLPKGLAGEASLRASASAAELRSVALRLGEEAVEASGFVQLNARRWEGMVRCRKFCRWERWQPLVARALASLDAVRVQASAPAAELKGVRMASARAVVRVRGKALALSSISARVWGGELAGKLSREGKGWDGEFRLSGVRIRPMLESLLGAAPIDGRADVRLRLHALRWSWAAMRGEGEWDARDLHWSPEVAMRLGAERFAAAHGRARWMEGDLHVEEAVVASERMRLLWRGRADLLRRSVAMDAEALVRAPLRLLDVQRRPGERVRFRIEGDWRDPVWEVQP